MGKKLYGYNAEHDTKLPPIPEEELKRIKDAVFSEKYLIDDQFITLVKQQHVGNCWAFASTAMMETFLLQNNMIKSSDQNEKIFSETHMTYSVFDISDPNSSVKQPGGCDVDSDPYGADRYDVLPYFACDPHAILEVLDPDFMDGSLSVLPKRDYDITAKKYSNFVLTGLKLIDDPAVVGSQVFINEIKDCIMNYGMVFLTYCHQEDMEKEITDDPDYGTTVSYYMNKTGDRNHAVAIMGWDDTFSDFANTPGNPGAFKVKNSWGTGGSLGDGYMWISYEDFNLGGCYCIIGMKETDPGTPQTVYTNAYFGMQRFLPDIPGEAQSVFSDSYTSSYDNETVTEIGLYNFTPCFATVELTVAGQTEVALLEKYYLEYPGFHRIEVPAQTLGLKGTTFEIMVTYDPVGLYTTYAPLEYKYDTGYSKINLDTLSGQVKDGNDIKSIITYNNDHGTQYGNVSICVYTEWDSETTKSYIDAYKQIGLPAVSADGLLTPLNTEISPYSGAEDVSVEWRVEPYGRGDYDQGYQSPISTFQINALKGMKNISDSDCDVYITAVVGEGNYRLKKKFMVTLPPATKNYQDYEVSDVTEANKVTIKGEVSGLTGATVYICSNDMKAEVKMDATGSWEKSDFELYDAKNGWKDSYTSTQIYVKICDDKENIILEGGKTVKLTRPFDVDGNTTTVDLKKVGKIGLLAALAYCSAYGMENLMVTDATELTLEGAGEPFFGNAEDINLDFNHTRIRAGNQYALLESCGDVQNLELDLQDVPLEGEDINSDYEKFACLALNVKSGSTIKNCTVKGTVTRSKSVGGLFYEGTDVTVENCTVNMDVKNADECGAVAHTITGNSSLENVAVEASISASKAAGIGMNTSGKISQCGVSLTATVDSEAAGVCCSANDAMISDVMVDCSLVSTDLSECSVAGVATGLTGQSSITNCVVVGKLDAGSDTGSIAYGIGKEPSENTDAISNCLCAPAFISGTKAFRISDSQATSCMAYQGIVNSKGTGFAEQGDVLKGAPEILSADLFTSLGFDMENIWQFETQKCIPYLKGVGTSTYGYPFPNPYATENGKYEFAVNTEIALYGASSPRADKITWGSLSPDDKVVVSEDQYLLSSDEFYLQAHLMITESGTYTMDIISVIDEQRFTYNINLEVVDN